MYLMMAMLHEKLILVVHFFKKFNWQSSCILCQLILAFLNYCKLKWAYYPNECTIYCFSVSIFKVHKKYCVFEKHL